MSQMRKILSEKLAERSQEMEQKALEKCREARDLIEKAYIKPDSDLLHDAVGAYLEAINFYPLLSEPYLGSGYIFWKLKNYENALKLFQKALEIDPLDKNALIIINEIKEEMKENSLPPRKEEKPKIIENPRPKKSFFSKILQIFSTVEQNTQKKKTSKEDFLHSVNEISRELINYEKLNTKVDKEVLSKISQAVNKNKFYDNKGDLLPPAITNLPIFEEEGQMELEINKMITEETKSKLESLKKQHYQDKIVAKFDREKFSFFKRPKLK